MPIINQVVGTRRRKLTPSDAVRSIEDCQKRDEKLYTVRFRNLEQPGGSISFFYRGHGRSIYDVTLQDNEVCDLPLGCIMRIRETCRMDTSPQTHVKSGNGIVPGEGTSVVDPRFFGLKDDGSMDGKRPGNNGHLYVLEFISDELKALENLWSGKPHQKSQTFFDSESTYVPAMSDDLESGNMASSRRRKKT